MTHRARQRCIVLHRSLMHFNLICADDIKKWSKFIILHVDIPVPVILASCVAKTVLSTLNFLNFLATLVEKELTIGIKIYFYTLNSVPLSCMSVLTPAPHCIGYCIFAELNLEE